MLNLMEGLYNMNQFDKSKIITVELKNVESIRSALKDYRVLLNNDEAVVQEVFDVEFRVKTQEGSRRLQVGDTKNQELLREAFKYGPDGDSEYLDSFDEIGEEDEVYLSEPILLAHAMEYDGLHEDVVATAMAIVAFSRRHNDTWKLWIDDMRVFGIETLYMLAKRYPEYTYLLGQFFIPYWDDEHAGEYSDYLFALLEERGWTTEMMKAYIWCDSRHMRIHMYIRDMYLEDNSRHGSLGDHLRATPEAYRLFKEMLKERLIAEPVLAYSYDVNPEEERPVLDFYKTLMPCDEDEVEEIINETFIEDSYEEEAVKVEKEIMSLIERPLIVFTAEQIKERREMEI